MCSHDLLLKTLKRIGYEEADSLSEIDFKTLTSEEEFKSFFEVFCTLDENNVLTTEDIKAYSALTPADIAEIEILKKNDQFEEIDKEEEKKKQAYFMQEQLALIENHNKALERQIDLFKKHEENLLQEKYSLQKFFFNARKEFKTFEITKVPKSEEELVSSFKSCLQISQDLESIFLNADSNHNRLPTSNFVKDVIQLYIKDEEKILQCINSYMQANFQLCEDGTFSFIHSEILRQEEFEKEASFFKKRLKTNMMDNAMSEINLSKTRFVMKHFETDAVSEIYHCSSSQIRLKLDNVVTLNEQLKKKEECYKSYVYDAISKHVDALITEMIFYASEEMINNFQFYVKKISFPKKYLLQQRLRIERLIASLNEHMDGFQNLKQIIQKVLKLIKEEQSCLDKRQMQIEMESNDIAKNQDDQLPEAIALSSLYKILATSKDFNVEDMSAPSIAQSVQEANRYLQVEENFKTIYEENIKTIDLIENHAECLESLLYANKNYSDWQDLEQSFNKDLNYLVVKLNCFEERISDCNKDIDEKQKLLRKMKNLQLARKLYVYALMNRELFEKYIDEIKLTVENSNK